jgi:hypothetical protein
MIFLFILSAFATADLTKIDLRFVFRRFSAHRTKQSVKMLFARPRFISSRGAVRFFYAFVLRITRL